MARLINADKLRHELIMGHDLVGAKYTDMADTAEAIPIEWITDWLTKQTIPATSYGLDCSAIEKMLGDWEKENE